MFCTRKINDDYTWVGADGRRLPMFEGVFGVPDGISFNSYLLQDEKTVLFDTADSAVQRNFKENVLHELNGRTLDYLVVHHMEPDHTALLEDLMIRFPRMQVYCSERAKMMIGQFFGTEMTQNVVVIKEGDTLCTGRHTLQFIAAPMVHWPEVMMTYDQTDHLLLTADAFGCFGALNGQIFADEVNFEAEFLDECRRYYSNIVGKYGKQVQEVLAKASKLDVQMLLPLHGFVWRKDIDWIIHKYDLWSRWEPEEKSVMIAYASVYGDTENAANILACRLAEQGVRVRMYDTSVTPASYIVSAAFRASHLVFAATTYNAGVFVTMDELLRDIAAHGLKNRSYLLLENGSWAPSSGRGMTEILKPLGWKELAEPVTIRSALQPHQEPVLERLAREIAQDMKRSAPAAKDDGKAAKQWVCRICGYIYEGDELPENFKCPLCGAAATYFDEKKEEPAKKWVCSVCGFIYEGPAVPADFRCPLCNAPADKFVEKKDESAAAAEPAKAAKKWVCSICGYIYEGDELPADFQCPLCKAPADKFEEKKD